jgi:hypothetical protein
VPGGVLNIWYSKVKIEVMEIGIVGVVGFEVIEYYC